MNQPTMRAQIAPRYGAPDIFQLVDLDRPEPEPNQVRVKISSTTVGPADCALRAGKPFMVKLIFGLRKPKYPVLGAEMAGVVDAVGSAVTRFRVGDAVLVHSPDIMGGYAEYLCLPESAQIVPKPTAISFDEAVAIADGASTALVFLRDGAKLQPGQRVLINGGSGSVGAAGIQLAKLLGAQVTAVASAKNQAFLRSLGADEVINYEVEDFTQNGKTYDVIFDAVGKSSYRKCRNSLGQAGVYLTTVPTIGILLRSLFTAGSQKRRGKFIAAGLTQTPEDLIELLQLAESKQLRGIIDKTYPLADLSQAHTYVETGRKVGTVVIAVGEGMEG